jgi:hypothetical protein
MDGRALKIINEILKRNPRAAEARRSGHDLGVDYDCWLQHTLSLF